METKTCFKCNQTKPLCDFYTHPRMADGHLGKCKECTKIDTKLNYWKNLDHYKEYDFNRSQTKERKEKASQYLKDHPGKRCLYNKKHREKFPDRQYANGLLKRAVDSGKMERLPCAHCGATQNIYGHHEDYSKPLDVIWLCPACHSTLHREYRQVANGSN